MPKKPLCGGPRLAALGMRWPEQEYGAGEGWLEKTRAGRGWLGIAHPTMG